MAKKAVVEFVPTWFDLCAPWQTFGCVLKWCDTAQGELFLMKSFNPVMQQLHYAWSNHSVMRSNTAHLLLNHNEIKQLKKVRVEPLLQDVGQTSWTCGFRITNALSPEATKVAEVETVMVNTDASHTSSQPIVNVDDIRKLIADSNNVPIRLGRPEFSSSKEVPDVKVFVFSTMARLIDCDSLGHVNNAIYGTLAEEWRHYAASQGAYTELEDFGGAPIATHPAATCSISYVGQARPLDPLKVTTWASPSSGGVDFNFEVHIRGQLIVQMNLGVERNRRAKL